MRTLKLIMTSVILCSSLLKAQDIKEARIPMLGEMAPSFTAESTQGKISFPGDYAMKWKILFSHPGDFTPVCSTELLELAAVQNDFAKLGTLLFVVSTDGLNSHLEWEKSLESINYKGRGPMKIDFPIMTDVNLEISKKYGMIHSYNKTTKDVRGVFIIDPDNKIAAIFFYPDKTGRNIDEIKRTLIALQATDDKTLLTPANWIPGGDFLLPSPATMEDSEKLTKRNDPGMYSLAWYLWFRKVK
jgi:peroxiredoxin 2/4